jgi:hypothetical protein
MIFFGRKGFTANGLHSGMARLPLNRWHRQYLILRFGGSLAIFGGMQISSVPQRGGAELFVDRTAAF